MSRVVALAALGLLILQTKAPIRQDATPGKAPGGARMRLTHRLRLSRWRIAVGALILALGTVRSAFSTEVPSLLPIPDGLREPLRSELQRESAALVSRLKALQSDAADFSRDCADVKAGSAKDAECQGRLGRLTASTSVYTADATRFNERVLGGVPGQPMPPRAAQLVAAMDEISSWPYFLNQRTGEEHVPLAKGKPVRQHQISLNCQYFFRALGEALRRRGLPSWSDAFPFSRSDGKMADAILEDIERMAAAGHRWRKVGSWAEAQWLANQGSVVVGGLRARDASDKQHAHIAIVFPTAPGMDWLKFASAGHGPFVRDGNEHLRRYPSTWGAIRASRAMPLAQTSWYVWSPSWT
jgi:hypothetical protein